MAPAPGSHFSKAFCKGQKDTLFKGQKDTLNKGQKDTLLKGQKDTLKAQNKMGFSLVKKFCDHFSIIFLAKNLSLYIQKHIVKFWFR